jgi:RimJ/RimL family protein N-acetyltransferase
MNKEKLLQEGAYSIWRYRGVPEEAVRFLEKIVWGTEGAVYEHKKTEERIRQLQDPTLLALYKDDEIAGTAVFCHTDVTVNGKAYNSYYVRYFASAKEIRGQGTIVKYGIKVMEMVREGETEKTIFFANIEKGNKASYKAVKAAGYHRIGAIKTHGFSRFFPKKCRDLERITTPEQQKEVRTLLEEQYNRHALVQFNSIFLNDDYYVLRENGEIVAGCQMHRALWVISHMPGLQGKILLKVVPHVPLLNKLFNPKRFEFLAFEGIYVKPGYEHRLRELFEGLLTKEKLRSSLFWLAGNCPVRKRILRNGKLGLIHSFVKESDVYIMTSFHDLSDREIQDIRNSPLFASGFDYI